MAEKSTTFGDYTDKSLFGVSELAGGDLQILQELRKQIMFSLRCCCPAIIKSINYDEMTVVVQPVIKENIKFGTQEVKEFKLPEIFDVPLVYLSSKDASITFPISVNDECLLFFADTCIDSWWQSGGIQSQFEERRHDLSDCFCLPCQMSQPKKITQISEESLKLRYGENEFEVKSDGIYYNKKNIINHKHQVIIGDQVYTTTNMIL